jgi:hypothetical protein
MLWSDIMSIWLENKQQTLFQKTLLSMLFALPLMAHAVPVTVPGTSNPWLSGMPPGSTASGGDIAPDHSPVEVMGLDLVSGNPLLFTNATGGVSHTGSSVGAPIDGAGLINHFPGAENGISDLRAPINSLIGVFLTEDQPDLSGAPDRLDFGEIGFDFTSLSPLLSQVFFIGDGLTSTGTTQQFNVPDGTARLFLGTMDGFGWFNNSGAITVDVSTLASPPSPPVSVPEPATPLLMALGIAALWVRQYGKIRHCQKKPNGMHA